ncbi:hypothetical protein [Ancrocorticia sp.]|uniref:hypothetical protein n=1 Tax=Ancrocorticia sp. TaxID=2593684 RepID=UPI003F923F2E
MATVGDKTLASQPELFELAESPQTARIYKMLGVMVFLIGAGFFTFSLVNGVVFMMIFSALMALVSPFVFWDMARKAREWRLRDGRTLRRDYMALRENPEKAWERLATGDPGVYTPMKAGGDTEHATDFIRAFWPEDEQITYIVVEQGKEPSPIITLHGEQHELFQQARARGLGRRFVGPGPSSSRESPPNSSDRPFSEESDGNAWS